MSVVAKISHLLKFPPHIIWQKVMNRLKEEFNKGKEKKHYEQRDLRSFSKARLDSVFEFLPLETDSQIRDFLVEMYTEHRFDLLGSGWVSASYDAVAPGLEKYRFQENLTINNFDESGEWLREVVSPMHFLVSQKIWKILLKSNPEYIPIDWQKDSKSGFRWTANIWFKDQRKRSDAATGADIKMPWELSRLQHLPRLISLKPTEKNCREAICQVLDFIMTNPVGMGVNFNCAMDVGIRLANIFIAFDWIRQLHPNLITEETESLISNYCKESTEHILLDIEYREGKTSNHYLGNVLGILFSGVYLPEDSRTLQYLAFGIQELQRSMERQFFNDGSNFEGSTAYHRLSGEMMIWGAAAMLKCNSEKLFNAEKVDIKKWNCKAPLFKPNFSWTKKESDKFWNKLIDSAKFSIDITKTSGEIVQFGDNDSGRFVSLSPIGKMETKSALQSKYFLWNSKISLPEKDFLFNENNLSHAAFVSAVWGLFKMNKEHLPKELYSKAEYEYFSGIRCDIKADEHWACDEVKATTNIPEEFKYYKEFEFDIPGGTDIQELQTTIYPDFQIGILRNQDLFIAIAGISNPNQHHSLSHVHNDKGAIELQIKGIDILTDPGTYLYTPIPERRIEFRDVEAHNTIAIKGYPQNPPLPGRMGLFNLKPKTKVLELTKIKDGLKLILEYDDVIHKREVVVNTEKVIIRDFCTHDFVQQFNPLPYISKGYGKIEKRP